MENDKESVRFERRIYAYAFDGHRARKVAGATTTVFHYDLEGRMIAETDAAGAALSEYVRDDEGRPLAQISGGTTTFLHPDHLGSPRFGTNASKTVVWQWSGNAFGETPPIGSVTINLRHPGQFFDKETNSNYNYYRDHYFPELGRYGQSDPIGLGGGINTYAYVGGNPVTYVDPLGLCAPGDTMCQIANRAAGLPPDFPSAPGFVINGSLSVNVPFGRIGPVPIGMSLACTVSNGSISSVYFGSGIVAGASATFTPRASAGPQTTSGDPSGLGLRTSLTIPVPGTPFAYGTSAFYGSSGSSYNPANTQLGGGLSGTATFGYNQRR